MSSASPPSLPNSPSEPPGGLLSPLKSRQAFSWFGPAFVASIAYIDPGNFGANLLAGTGFGYKLLWVLLWSNLMAILIQYLSAKLGIATGLTLPQNCREHFSRTTSILLWVAAELSALATDLAEFLGAALGFYLLFGGYFLHLGLSRTTVMFLAAMVSAVCVFGILALELRGFRTLELGIMVFVLVIGLCYLAEIFMVHPDWQPDRVPYGGSVAGSPEHLRGCQHAGGDGDAARGVSAFGPGAAAAGAGTTLKPIPDDRRLSRLNHLRLEVLDVLAAMNSAWLVNSPWWWWPRRVCRHRPRRHVDRRCPSHAGAIVGPCFRDHLCRGAAVFWPVVLVHRGHPCRADDSGGISESAFQHLPAAVVDAAAGDDRDWGGTGSATHPGALPGGAEFYPAVCSGSAGYLCSRRQLMGEFTNGVVIHCLGWLTAGLDYCSQRGSAGMGTHS